MFVKTLNITDSVSNIATSTTYKYYWVRNLGAEDVSVFRAFSDIDTNKKIVLSQNEYVKIMPENNNIYFKSSSAGTKIEVYGTNTDICPFKTGKAEGSGGGGYSETVLWEYTGSKPTTMVLSQPVTDFDVIITYGADNGNEYAFQPTVHLVSEIQKGLLFGVGIAASDARQWYDYVNATTFEINRFMNKPYLPIKVVGIKLSSR